MKKPISKPSTPYHILLPAKIIFWFTTGVVLGLFFLVSFVFIIFQNTYANRVYPGIMVRGINFGGKTQNEVRDYFKRKNALFQDTTFAFTLDQEAATISAKQLELGYDENLLAQQAYSIGRTNNIPSNFYMIFQAYINGIELSSSYRYNDNTLMKTLTPIIEKTKIEPVDGLFKFENGRVTAFQPSMEGQEVDIEKLKLLFESKKTLLLTARTPTTIVIPIPLKILKPKVSTDQANNLGIKELISTGTSLFQGSIENRIYNVTLAASRLNGVLVAPNEEFSFNKALGDVTKFTGYKEAYVIENGRTVLGDGGGVCQVSTTLFRAILNAGLPVIERHGHAYRVHYYEEDSGPGMDATVYSPTVDFKFKNDSGNYILIQTFVDPSQLRLTFYLYGKKDGREATLTEPVVLSQTPPPDPLYQDDPSLPKGAVKQIDFSAWGAQTKFSRKVTKNGQVLIQETYTTNYQPWRAIYLRGPQ